MADEMAAKYREMLLAKASGQPLESIEIPNAVEEPLDLVEEEIPSAMEEAEIPPEPVVAATEEVATEEVTTEA